MNVQKLLKLIFMLMVGLSLSSPDMVQATPRTYTEAPVNELVSSPPIAMMSNTTDGPIIIDHTCTDLSQIPSYWLEDLLYYRRDGEMIRHEAEAELYRIYHPR